MELMVLALKVLALRLMVLALVLTVLLLLVTKIWMAISKIRWCPNEREKNRKFPEENSEERKKYFKKSERTNSETKILCVSRGLQLDFQ